MYFHTSWAERELDLLELRASFVRGLGECPSQIVRRQVRNADALRVLFTASMMFCSRRTSPVSSWRFHGPDTEPLVRPAAAALLDVLDLQGGDLGAA